MSPSIRRRWCRASTSKQRTRFAFHSTKNKKWENGEDIEQGSSLAVVFNQSKKNWSNKNVFLSCETWNVAFVVCEKWNGHFIFHQTWSIPNLVGRVLSYPPLRRRENLGTRLINTTPPPAGSGESRLADKLCKVTSKAQSLYIKQRFAKGEQRNVTDFFKAWITTHSIFLLHFVFYNHCLLHLQNSGRLFQNCSLRFNFLQAALRCSSL